jgi:hypothetical protein
LGGRKISNCETAIDDGAGECVEGYVYPQDAGEGARFKPAAEVVAVRPLDRSKGDAFIAKPAKFAMGGKGLRHDGVIDFPHLSLRASAAM